MDGVRPAGQDWAEDQPDRAGLYELGDPKSTSAHLWSLDDEEAQPFFRQAVELGVTFWDPANVYQHGTSEELVGRAIKRYARREDIVLATKVHGRMHDEIHALEAPYTPHGPAWF